MAAGAAALLVAPPGGVRFRVVAVGYLASSVHLYHTTPGLFQSCTRAYAVVCLSCGLKVLEVVLEDVLRGDFGVESTGVEFSVPFRSARIGYAIFDPSLTPGVSFFFFFGFLQVEIIFLIT